MQRLRYAGDYTFEIDGSEAFRERNEMIVVPMSVIVDVSAVSVRDALGAYLTQDGYGSSVELWLSPDEEYFDEDLYSVSDVHLESDGDVLSVVVTTGIDALLEEDNTSLMALFAPLERRLRTSVVHAGTNYDVVPPTVTVELLPPVARRSVGDVLAIAEQFSALAAASLGEGLTPSSTADLLRGAAPDALLGQPECEWLDAKRSPPKLTTDSDKFEFAKDVAAFANAPAGGLIAYGLSTSATPGGDVVSRVTAFPPQLLRPAALLALVRHRIYPAPIGVRAEVIPYAGDLAVGLVLIPPQPNDRKPFVVRGAVVDGRVRQNFVAVPIRVGEHAIWDDVAAIHALMVAGRAALASAD